jgi:hypothetical protein
LLFLLPLASIAAVSCLDVADDRARRDLEIGVAADGPLALAIDGGLAHVRVLRPDTIGLWAQAPIFSGRLTIGTGGGGPLAIEVENALPDARLTVRTEEGEELPVTAEVTSRPTKKRWTVGVSAASTVTLAVGPSAVSPSEEAAPWRFAIFADVQESIDRVQDIYARMNLDPSLRFALVGGDLTKHGTAQELERFQREMETLAFPAYATLGNHELFTREDLFHHYFGRGSFCFAFGGVQFSLLDSASATVAPAAYGWLDEWLLAGADRLHVVVTHIPPLDPVGSRAGAFASRAEANKLLSRLHGGRVDLTVYGHIHSYYAFQNAGIPAFISGGGGAYPETFDGVGRHYLAVDVDPGAGTVRTSVVRID